MRAARPRRAQAQGAVPAQAPRPHGAAVVDGERVAVPGRDTDDAPAGAARAAVDLLARERAHEAKVGAARGAGAPPSAAAAPKQRLRHARAQAELPAAVASRGPHLAVGREGEGVRLARGDGGDAHGQDDLGGFLLFFFLGGVKKGWRERVAGDPEQQPRRRRAEGLLMHRRLQNPHHHQVPVAAVPELPAIVHAERPQRAVRRDGGRVRAAARHGDDLGARARERGDGAREQLGRLRAVSQAAVLAVAKGGEEEAAAGGHACSGLAAAACADWLGSSRAGGRAGGGLRVVVLGGRAAALCPPRPTRGAPPLSMCGATWSRASGKY